MSETIPEVYESDAGLKVLANYLRSANGVKVRSAIEHDKRVDYFKGKRLVECIMDAKKWPKKIPKITDKAVAVAVAQTLIKKEYFHRSEKVEGKKGHLMYSQKNVFEETGYYTWMYAGSMVWSNMATAAVIAVVIGFTLLPIWPEIAKKILWYFSVTFLIVTLLFVFVRFLAFVFMWLLGYEFWVFPRLFDESLSFSDSFKPIYSFEKGTKGQGYYRIALLLLLVGFVYWAMTQPTEFDGFVKAQRDFIDDLYSGNLLADVAYDQKINIDRTRKVPNLEDLLREVEEEERLEAQAHDFSADVNNDTDNESDGSSHDNSDGSSSPGFSQEQLDDAMIDELIRGDNNSEENEEERHDET